MTTTAVCLQQWETVLGQYANLATFCSIFPEKILPIPFSICLWTFSPLFFPFPFCANWYSLPPAAAASTFFHRLLWEVPSIICVNLVYPLLECPAVLALHDLANNSSASVVCYQLPSQFWKLRSYLFLLQNSLSKLKSSIHFNFSFFFSRSSILLIPLVSLLFIF